MEYLKIDEDAVSGIIGEMLMITLAIILVSVFAVSVLQCAPAERDPSVTVLMNSTDENITLWHKGGDWVKKSDLRIIVLDKADEDKWEFCGDDIDMEPDGQTFCLGSSLSVTVPDDLDDGEEVRLATGRNVLFTGRVVKAHG